MAEFAIGDRVRHPIYGIGEVVQLMPAAYPGNGVRVHWLTPPPAIFDASTLTRITQ